LGAVSGVVFASVFRAKRTLDDALFRLDDAQRRIVIQRRIETLVARVQRECDEALLRFITTLSNSLDSTFVAIPSLISELKSARSRRSKENNTSDEELQLWNKLKVTVFTKLVVSIYGFHLVNLVLRLQLHILGRIQSTQNTTDVGDKSLSVDDRASFLSLTYNYILGDGLHALAGTVAPIAAEVLSDVSFGKRLDCSSITALVRRIREKVEGPTSECAMAPHPLVQFIIFPSHLRKGVSPLTQAMLEETWDCAESPQFARALTASLDRSLDLLGDQLSKTLFTSEAKTPPSSSDASASSENVESMPVDTVVTKPLPSLLVQLKPSKTIFLISHVDGRSAHADSAALLGDVRVLCDAIFRSEPPLEEVSL
jgi:hypothetical protein